MTQYTRNILKVYKQCTEEEIAHGMTWYADAKSYAYDICDKYELPLHIVIGVIAALSPTNRWPNPNLRNADDMCRIFTEGEAQSQLKSEITEELINAQIALGVHLILQF